MKTCFRCGEIKELDLFYKHSAMADGHLNKCKECTKGDSQKTYKKIISTPELSIKERARQRAKEQKRREEGRVGKYKRIINKNPVHGIVANAIKSGKITKTPCVVCGNKRSQGHHEDYNKPLDVVWLCSRHHADRHIHLRDAQILGINPLNINDFIETLKTNAI